MITIRKRESADRKAESLGLNCYSWVPVLDPGPRPRIRLRGLFTALEGLIRWLSAGLRASRHKEG
jgi:hypothetical protein